MEGKEAGKYPVGFEDSGDTDTFGLRCWTARSRANSPRTGYSFGSYHSKTKAAAGTIRCAGTFETKEFTVPVSKADDLRKFYRIIAGDERNSGILGPSASHSFD